MSSPFFVRLPGMNRCTCCVATTAGSHEVLPESSSARFSSRIGHISSSSMATAALTRIAASFGRNSSPHSRGARRQTALSGRSQPPPTSKLEWQQDEIADLIWVTKYCQPTAVLWVKTHAAGPAAAFPLQARSKPFRKGRVFEMMACYRPKSVRRCLICSEPGRPWCRSKNAQIRLTFSRLTRPPIDRIVETSVPI